VFSPQKAKEIDTILSDKSRGLKEQDSMNVAKSFLLMEDEYDLNLSLRKNSQSD